MKIESLQDHHLILNNLLSRDCQEGRVHVLIDRAGIPLVQLGSQKESRHPGKLQILLCNHCMLQKKMKERLD